MEKDIVPPGFERAGKHKRSDEMRHRGAFREEKNSFTSHAVRLLYGFANTAKQSASLHLLAHGRRETEPNGRPAPEKKNPHPAGAGC
jgi:hypothetical protein